MLGVEFQSIYCNVKKCKYCERNETLDGKTDRVVEVYYTCNKDDIYLDSSGRCKEAKRRRR